MPLEDAAGPAPPEVAEGEDAPREGLQSTAREGPRNGLIGRNGRIRRDGLIGRNGRNSKANRGVGKSAAPAEPPQG